MQRISGVFYLLVLIVFFPLTGLPQEFDNRLIIVGNNVFDSYRNELEHEQLVWLMKDYTEPLSYLRKAKAKRNVGNLLLILGIVTGAPGIILGEAMLANDDYKYEKLTYILLGSSFSFSITGIIVKAGYNRNIRFAVELYNERFNQSHIMKDDPDSYRFINYKLGLVINL